MTYVSIPLLSDSVARRSRSVDGRRAAEPRHRRDHRDWRGALLILEQAERGRLGRGLDAGVDSELAEDCRHMAIDRTAREKEPLRDLRVATALADEREDLALASRQPSDVAAGRGPRAAADVANAER